MGRHAPATMIFGEVAEWSNAPDSKSGLRFRRNVGSNPTLSATFVPQSGPKGEAQDVPSKSRLLHPAGGILHLPLAQQPERFAQLLHTQRGVESFCLLAAREDSP